MLMCMAKFHTDYIHTCLKKPTLKKKKNVEVEYQRAVFVAISRISFDSLS